MKKFLLIAVMAIMATASAFAVTDNQTYDPVNDIKIANQWILDRVHTSDFASMDACNTRARTAVMSNGVIYVAHSEAKQVIEGTDTTMAAVIYRFNAADGTQLPTLDVTYNNEPFGNFLGVNSIGTDNFGHIWIASYSSEKTATMPLYQLNTETGELTLIAELEKGDNIARTDYADVMGDITREEAECNVMTVGASVATIYRWHCEQGSDEWEGGFEGDTYIDITAFYPESVTQWGYAPCARMILGEEDDTKYAGELYYIDGFNSAPAIYDLTGSLIDSFDGVDSELFPEAGTNGVAEFHLDGRNFIAYSKAQYSGDGHGCQANICEMGEGQTLAGMQKYWQVPADSLGKMSDGGLRIHCLNVEYGQEGGEECVTLFTYKCYNGMGVYKIGKNVGGSDPGLKGDINADGIVNVTDVTALINTILGTADYSETVCDINGDGVVNVTDITVLINLILG